jgi:hypothetical protein
MTSAIIGKLMAVALIAGLMCGFSASTLAWDFMSQRLVIQKGIDACMSITADIARGGT